MIYVYIVEVSGDFGVYLHQKKIGYLFTIIIYFSHDGIAKLISLPAGKDNEIKFRFGVTIYQANLPYMRLHSSDHQGIPG